MIKMTCCRVTRQKYVGNSRHSEVRPLVVPSPRFSSPLSTLLSGNFFTRLKSNDANCVKKHSSDASIEQHDAATRGAYKNQHSALKKTVPENEQRRLLLKKYKSELSLNSQKDIILPPLRSKMMITD